MRMFKSATLAAAIAAAASMFGLAGAQAQAPDSYKIGLIASITGPGSFLGDPFANAAKLAVERANAAGGIAGKKIELVVYDTEASADKTLVFAKKLISEDKVSVILGPDFSGTVRAILPTTDAAGIPVLYNTPVIEPKAGSFHFTPWPSEGTSYRVALTSLKGRNVKKLAILATTDLSGESGMKQVQRLAGEYGMTVGAVERMELQDKDVTAQLTNIKGAAPDAVFFAGSGAAVAVVAKGYTRLGLKQPLTISTGAVSANFPALLKGIAPDTLIFPTYKMLLVDSLPANDPNREPIQTFLKLFQDKYGKKTDFYGGAGWDLANIAIAAMKKVGNNPGKIRDAVQQIKDFPGTMAVLTFTPENHRGAGPDAQLMGQFKDDKFVLVK